MGLYARSAPDSQGNSLVTDLALVQIRIVNQNPLQSLKSALIGATKKVHCSSQPYNLSLIHI